jgi:hypothetical protein
MIGLVRSRSEEAADASELPGADTMGEAEGELIRFGAAWSTFEGGEVVSTVNDLVEGVVSSVLV